MYIDSTYTVYVKVILSIRILDFIPKVSFETAFLLNQK